MGIVRVVVLMGVVALCLGAGGAVASSSGVGPFGLDIGSSSRADVLRQFPCAEAAGINRWSHGHMTRVAGASLPLQGAQSALFIFDTDDTLQAVTITMSKHRFDAMRGLLNEIYPQVSAQVPFVGNKRVVWNANNVHIELDSPHLSFEMELRYLAEGFLRLFQEQSAIEQQNQRQQQAGQL